MRTTLDHDDELMAALLARFPGVSTTGAIERAVRDRGIALLWTDSAGSAVSRG